MNDADRMMPCCGYCPYWEVCEPPYVCSVTEAKFRLEKDENKKQEQLDTSEG